MTSTPDNPPAGGKRVLVAEDQAVVAMAMGDELTDAGYEIVGPFATCAAAMDWLARDTPDFAILDVELRDGPCTDLARELQHRGVRFAVFSGSMKTHSAALFREVPWFEKPSDMTRLVAALVAL